MVLADASATDAPSLARDAGDETADAGPETSDGTAAAVDPSAVLLDVEPTHRLWQRPRPRGAVYAAGHDERLARWNLGGSSDPDHPASRASFHPGARVKVDVRAIGARLPERRKLDRRTGRREPVLTAGAVVAQARKHGYWPFRLCYEDALRRSLHLRPHGPHPKGKTLVRLDVSARGRSRARLVSSRLADEHAVLCLLARSGELAFTPPPGRQLDLELSIELWPGDAPLPSTGPPEGAGVTSSGRFDPDAVARAAEPARDAIRACYAEALGRDRALWGRVALRVDLDAAGRVLAVREHESRFPDRTVVRCARRALRRIRFPAPAEELSFVYAVRLGAIPEP